MVRTKLSKRTAVSNSAAAAAKSSPPLPPPRQSRLDIVHEDNEDTKTSTPKKPAKSLVPTEFADMSSVEDLRRQAEPSNDTQGLQLSQLPPNLTKTVLGQENVEETDEGMSTHDSFMQLKSDRARYNYMNRQLLKAIQGEPKRAYPTRKPALSPNSGRLRPKRIRFPPLDRFRGERIVYDEKGKPYVDPGRPLDMNFPPTWNYAKKYKRNMMKRVTSRGEEKDDELMMC